MTFDLSLSESAGSRSLHRLFCELSTLGSLKDDDDVPRAPARHICIESGAQFPTLSTEFIHRAIKLCFVNFPTHQACGSQFYGFVFPFHICPFAERKGQRREPAVSLRRQFERDRRLAPVRWTALFAEQSYVRFLFGLPGF